MGDSSWFALSTKPGFERAVAFSLHQRGYEEFLPVYREKRRWSDRFKEIELPLFPGYLFCRFDPYRRLPIMTTPGITSIVGVGKTPVPVDDAEIAAIRTIVACRLALEPWPYLEVGSSVTITGGPLAGLHGLLVAVKGQHRLVVSVTLLQRSVAVEIDSQWVRPDATARLSPASLQAAEPL